MTPAARRCLRATCPAARAAVDEGARGVRVEIAADCAGLSAALAGRRFPGVKQLDCFAHGEAQCREAAGALRALAPRLESLHLVMWDHFHDPERLIAALAGCSRLRDLTLGVTPNSGAQPLLWGLARRLPQLTRLVCNPGNAHPLKGPTCAPCSFALEDLPWQQMEVGVANRG